MQHRKFTLVELLVSLCVFSILLIVFMQIFSGMRLAWTNTEKRNDVYGDVRVAMDMMSVLLSSVYYSSNSTIKGTIEGLDQRGHYPFLIDKTSSRPHRIYFAANTVYTLPGTNPIRFVGFLVQKQGVSGGVADTYSNMNNNLYLAVYSNLDSKYYRFFPNFLKEGANNTEVEEVACDIARDEIKGLLDGRLGSGVTGNRIKLLDNVVDFQVKGFDDKGNEITGSEIKCVPWEVEIRISVMAEDDLSKWKSLSGQARSDFQLQNQMTFTRRVFIGDRMTLEVKDE